MLTMKKLALSTLMSSSLLFYPVLQASAETPQHVVKQLAGGYRVQVGDVIVTSFTDGTVAQDLHKLLRRTTPQKIDALLRKWLRMLPHPFTAQDRRAGYLYDVSILQAEFSLTQVLDRPLTGRVFFEEVIRENIDIGRPSHVQSNRHTRPHC